MAPRERDPEDNDRRRPRAFRHPEGSDGEDLVDDDDDIDDDDDDDDDEDSDDEELEIPPDPAHEARMAALRAENAELLRQREAEDRLLQQEISLRDQIFRDVQRMEARRQELLEQRERDLQELAALESDSSDDAQENDLQQPNEVMAFHNNREAQKAASASENQPKQKDDDSDPGGNSSMSTSQPTN